MAMPLQAAMFTIVDVFQEYAGKGGDKYKLSKAETKKLLQDQFGLGKEAEEILAGLDSDLDGELDFNEFMGFVILLTMGINEFFNGGQQRCG